MSYLSKLVVPFKVELKGFYFNSQNHNCDCGSLNCDCGNCDCDCVQCNCNCDCDCDDCRCICDCTYNCN